MPLRRGNRFITFLVCICLAFLLNATYVTTVNDSMTPTQERIVTACLLAATFTAGFARLEYLTRKTKHDLRSDINGVDLRIQHESRDMPERVVKKINGGIEHEARKALEDSALPSTPEQWNKSCDEIAEAAATRAVAKYIEKTKPGST